MKVKGTVKKSDLEGGFLTISDGKKTWKLEGATGLEEGMNVEVDGREDTMMGIGFGTPSLRVKSFKVV